MGDNSTTMWLFFLNIHFPLSKLKIITLGLFKKHEFAEPGYLLLFTLTQSGKVTRHQKLKGQIWKFSNFNPPPHTKISA
jgi:hypothetical protein